MHDPLIWQFYNSISNKSHCLHLVLNTQDTKHFYCHQFWNKNDGENICHWNYFQIPWALSELPANWPGLTSLCGWISLASKQVTTKGLMGSENNFNGIYFHYHFLYQNWCQWKWVFRMRYKQCGLAQSVPWL